MVAWQVEAIGLTVLRGRDYVLFKVTGYLQESALAATYIRGTNMMCAFGVPGCIIQGPPSTGAAERPIDAAVA